MDNLENLIQQLKTVKLPDEENQLHRQELRRQLLSSKYFDQKGGELVMIIKKAGVLASLVLLVGAGVFFGFVSPKLAVARATEIAENDPQIQTLMQGFGVVISNVELSDGNAQVTLGLPSDYSDVEGSAAGVLVPFATANINLDAESVENLEVVELTREMFEDPEKVQEMLNDALKGNIKIFNIDESFDFNEEGSPVIPGIVVPNPDR